MQKRRQRRSLGHIVCQAASNGKVPDKPRRVVVTGMGVVSTLGHDPDEFYDNLLKVGRHYLAREIWVAINVEQRSCARLGTIQKSSAAVCA